MIPSSDEQQAELSALHTAFVVVVDVRVLVAAHGLAVLVVAVSLLHGGIDIRLPIANGPTSGDTVLALSLADGDSGRNSRQEEGGEDLDNRCQRILSDRSVLARSGLP